MFKLGSDLGTNSNEIINRDDKKKKKMFSLVNSIDNLHILKIPLIK